MSRKDDISKDLGKIQALVMRINPREDFWKSFTGHES
jgi:hypothetical protein